MNIVDAQRIVVGVWNGQRRDKRFVAALALLGIKAETFNALISEARQASRAFPGHLILTPTSAGRRR